MIDVQY